jgi:uncharacterized membrane protein YfcA
MPLIGFLLAALIGVALGLLGGGGSILTVPVLVYVLGFPAKQGIAIGLAVVGLASVVGAFGHWRRGNVRLQAAFAFGGVAMFGTFAGARLAHFLTGPTQLVIFALVMLAAAHSMHRNASASEPPPSATVTRPRLAIVAASAVGVGLLTGIAGVGGGFLIVPALVLFVGLPMREAVGTSLVVIAINSFVGFAGYLGTVEVPWAWLGAFSAVAMGGIVIGTRVSASIEQRTLKRGFSVFLLAMALFILAKNVAPTATDAPLQERQGGQFSSRK